MENQEQRKAKLVEEIGVILESTGYSPIPGRVVATLLLSEEAALSFDAIQEELKASKGSISQSLHHLMDRGIVSYFTKPGDRKRYFYVNMMSWKQMIRKKFSFLGDMRRITEEILDYRKDKGPEELVESLSEVNQLYAYMEQELPKIIEKWNFDNEK